MRKPGINMKLAESWEGPHTVVKRNSPPSYQIDTGDRVIPSVYVHLLKQYQTKADNPRVTRVTSVFEPDTVSDTIIDWYSEVQVSGEELDGKQAADVMSWESNFQDILTKEPGLTSLVKFGIDTGDHPPINQRAYSTSSSLRERIYKEIDWLLNKNFIRPSDSQWASPWGLSENLTDRHAYVSILKPSTR